MSKGSDGVLVRIVAPFLVSDGVPFQIVAPTQGFDGVPVEIVAPTQGSDGVSVQIVASLRDLMERRTRPDRAAKERVPETRGRSQAIGQGLAAASPCAAQVTAARTFLQLISLRERTTRSAWRKRRAARESALLVLVPLTIGPLCTLTAVGGTGTEAPPSQWGPRARGLGGAALGIIPTRLTSP